MSMRDGRPAPTPSLPIAGCGERFPVRRILCVGQNYAAHAREMGADVIIAVNLGTPLLRPDQIEGLLDAIERHLQLLRARVLQEQQPPGGHRE